MLRLVDPVPVLLFVLLLGGCTRLKEDTTVCPEYRKLRCVSHIQCSMDDKRRCRVCQCEAIDQGRGVPPDQPRPQDPANQHIPIRP